MDKLVLMGGLLLAYTLIYWGLCKFFPDLAVAPGSSTGTKA